MSTVRFRAGRVSYDPETKIATPDPIQGQITIKPSEEDESFYSFEWVPKEAAVNVEKEELLVIPGDVQWKHIPNAKDGRVFELSFLSSSARHLFWLQDINDFDDDDKLDQLSEKDKATFAKIQKIFEPVEEQEDEEQMEESVPEVAAEPTLQAYPLYDLQEVLTPEAIQSLLDNITDIQLQKLYSFLPEDQEKSKENLRSVLYSSFFKRSAGELTSALNNGGGFTVSRALGHPYEGEGIAAYLNSLFKEANRKE